MTNRPGRDTNNPGLIWKVLSIPLFYKIFGIGVIVASLLGSVMIFQARSNMSRALYSNLELKARSEVHSLVAAIEQAVAINDIITVQRNLERVNERLSDLRYVIVRDTRDTIIAHTFEHSVPIDLLRSHVSLPASTDSFRVMESAEGLIFEITSPLLQGHGGLLQLGLIDRTVQSGIASLTSSSLIVLAASVLISFALAHVLTYMLTYPITHLEEASLRIGEGDFTTRSRVYSDDEIGQLATSFNSMAANLQSYRQRFEDKEKERLALLQKIVTVQEEERRVLSRELHDEVGQSLIAMLCSVQAKCDYSSLDGSVCDELEGKLRELVEEIQRLAWGMRPSILDDYGLELALGRYIEETSKHALIEIDYHYKSRQKQERLPSTIEVTLYRIAQEAVTNIIKHSSAKRGSVVVLQGPEEIALLVEDDGCGFEPESVPLDTRLGLTGMRERAILLGGTFEIESASGNGTTIRVIIPFKGAEL